MKIAIRILACILLVIVILTVVETIRFMDLPKLFDDEVDPEEKYMALAIPMGLIICAYLVFLEAELFIGLQSFLLGIKNRNVLCIIASSFIILSVLASIVFLIWTDRFHDTMPHVLEKLQLQIILSAIIIIIVSNATLISNSIVSKIRRSLKKI